MKDSADHPWQGLRAALATMHGKERAIAPLFRRFLDVTVTVPAGSDTDRFGTFTREIARQGSMLDAARAKARLALELDPESRLGIASEGSFGPDPQLHFMSAGQELIIIIDRESELELVGHHRDYRTNFAAATVTSVEESLGFARRVRFPSHGLIVMAEHDGKSDCATPMTKGIHDVAQLQRAVSASIALCGNARVETDMRAHHNPTRMQAIRHAALDLVRGYRRRCPGCARPGYSITERNKGLPCADCGLPTALSVSVVWTCAGCAHSSVALVDARAADARYCDRCNP